MDVTVRALDLAGITAPQWEALAALLDDEERARAARFAFEEDRRSYVAAHGLLRLELSRRAARPPQDWRFAATKLGKPYLLDCARDLRFSLSHTRGMVAVAVADGAEIGVDVEPSDRRAESMKLAQRFFAPEEVALLAAVEGAARRDMFFAIWTLKEAVVKTTGQGLARALDSFAIALDPPRVTMLDGSAQQWSAAHWRRGSFHFALAAQGPVRADFSEAELASLL
ncbi:4'-phosphopantetheinyl transferase family protein [Methylocystis parvus]|uniref:4'-phosphopantetheinyl transferase superfamily protein n=1 Tax=Methylocystis parvus TaxID=134 RepID=A0A6B8M3B8_9HYPH|nr:4'-phosphopantetheinyl transferase superfamily protein [Methylocystis parvus]QGM96622.1 4'-phosphopantetheinyl transferase superfamily protein [Methylocystis parvus]WBJ99522.1 4'-phosphopantetheinyl transferase superfamily protein [Methylocystis parvus OBBP]